jgi:hypothetical protein
MFTIEKLSQQLVINDYKVIRFKERVLGSFKNKISWQEIRDQQCENRKQTTCYSCNDQGGCAILRGIVYLHISNIKEAIDEIEKAKIYFHDNNNEWNKVIRLTLLGIAHEMDDKRHQALLDYQQGIHILENYCRIKQSEYQVDRKAQALQKDLEYLLDHPYPYAPKVKTDKSHLLGNKTRMVLPWIPAYTGLQAGPNGPIWTDSLQEENGAYIDDIILNDKSYSFHSLKQMDKLITLTNDKKYGWAKISGDSMNAAKPVAILENDFVLFYESTDADNNAIVIASCPDDTGAGYKFIVKRYSKSDGHLISETNPPNKYNHILLNKDTRIIGTVVALAKPIQ